MRATTEGGDPPVTRTMRGMCLDRIAAAVASAVGFTAWMGRDERRRRAEGQSRASRTVNVHGGLEMPDDVRLAFLAAAVEDALWPLHPHAAVRSGDCN